MTDQQDAAGSGKSGLRFDTDPGSSRPFWVATLLLVALVAWMGSGYVFPGDEPVQDDAAPEATPPSVLVRASTAEPVILDFKSEGQAIPDRDSIVVAETSGEIVDVPVRKGQRVSREDVIARLDDVRAQSALDRAVEQLANAQREFDNATSLLERGTSTQTRVSEASAALAAARSDVISAEQTLDDLVIKAPFAGLIETLPVSAGEYISSGDEVARVVDNDPLTVTIQVPQQSLSRLRVGQTAEVRFITGQVREGTLGFVGSSAQSGTRTFLTEILVDNADGEIPGGVSAAVTIPTGETMAHFVRPSIISLNPDGYIGVKLVEDGRVRFQRIKVVKTELDGVWVSGFGEDATIITVGQGFVRDGEAVQARSEDDPETEGTDPGEPDAPEDSL